MRKIDLELKLKVIQKKIHHSMRTREGTEQCSYYDSITILDLKIKIFYNNSDPKKLKGGEKW